MPSPFSPAAMRARFAEINDLRAPTVAKLDELKSKRDALLAEYEPQVRALEEEIRELNAAEIEEGATLFDLDVERANLVRALKGKTSEPVEEAPAEPEAEPAPA